MIDNGKSLTDANDSDIDGFTRYFDEKGDIKNKKIIFANSSMPKKLIDGKDELLAKEAANKPAMAVEEQTNEESPGVQPAIAMKEQTKEESPVTKVRFFGHVKNAGKAVGRLSVRGYDWTAGFMQGLTKGQYLKETMVAIAVLIIGIAYFRRGYGIRTIRKLCNGFNTRLERIESKLPARSSYRSESDIQLQAKLMQTVRAIQTQIGLGADGSPIPPDEACEECSDTDGCDHCSVNRPSIRQFLELLLKKINANDSRMAELEERLFAVSENAAAKVIKGHHYSDEQVRQLTEHAVLKALQIALDKYGYNMQALQVAATRGAEQALANQPKQSLPSLIDSLKKPHGDAKDEFLSRDERNRVYEQAALSAEQQKTLIDRAVSTSVLTHLKTVHDMEKRITGEILEYLQEVMPQDTRNQRIVEVLMEDNSNSVRGLVERHLLSKRDVNRPILDKLGALQVAIRNGKMRSATELLRLGASVQPAAKDGEHATQSMLVCLGTLAMEGRTEKFKSVLRSDVFSRLEVSRERFLNHLFKHPATEQETTIMCLAMAHGKLDTAQLLNHWGAQYDVCDARGNSPISLLCEFIAGLDANKATMLVQEAIERRVLTTKHLGIQFSVKAGSTTLCHDAVRKGNVSLVRMLVEYGFDLSNKGDYTNLTPPELCDALLLMIVKSKEPIDDVRMETLKTIDALFPAECEGSKDAQQDQD